MGGRSSSLTGLVIVIDRGLPLTDQVGRPIYGPRLNLVSHFTEVEGRVIRRRFEQEGGREGGREGDRRREGAGTELEEGGRGNRTVIRSEGIDRAMIGREGADRAMNAG